MSSRRTGATRRRTCGCCGSRTPRLTGAEASTAADGDAGVPEVAANEEPWAAGIRAHLERRGWTQGELAARSSLKPNTVGAVLRGDPTTTRTLTAIAAGFGVGGRGACRRRGPRTGRPLDRGAGAPRRGGPDAGRGEGRRDAAPRADPGRVGRRRAGGPGGAPGAGGDRRGRGGSPGRAGAFRVRPGRGTRRILGSMSGAATRSTRRWATGLPLGRGRGRGAQSPRAVRRARRGGRAARRAAPSSGSTAAPGTNIRHRPLRSRRSRGCRVESRFMHTFLRRPCVPRPFQPPPSPCDPVSSTRSRCGVGSSSRDEHRCSPDSRGDFSVPRSPVEDQIRAWTATTMVGGACER